MAIAPMNCTAPHVSRRCRPPAGRQCQDAPCILHSQLAMHACVVTCTVRQEWHCMSGAAEQYSDARMAGRAGAGALAAALGKRTYRGIVRMGTIDVEVCIEGKGCRMRGVQKSGGTDQLVGGASAPCYQRGRSRPQQPQSQRAARSPLVQRDHHQAWSSGMGTASGSGSPAVGGRSPGCRRCPVSWPGLRMTHSCAQGPGDGRETSCEQAGGAGECSSRRLHVAARGRAARRRRRRGRGAHAGRQQLQQPQPAVASTHLGQVGQVVLGAALEPLQNRGHVVSHDFVGGPGRVEQLCGGKAEQAGGSWGQGVGRFEMRRRRAAEGGRCGGAAAKPAIAAPSRRASARKIQAAQK